VYELLNPKPVRRHALQGIEHAVQHVVRPVKYARALDGGDVRRILDDADARRQRPAMVADSSRNLLGAWEHLGDQVVGDGFNDQDRLVAGVTLLGGGVG